MKTNNRKPCVQCGGKTVGLRWKSSETWMVHTTIQCLNSKCGHQRETQPRRGGEPSASE